MTLNAEALDILAYLKTAPNKFVSLLEISRRAGGRRRFEETPNWARNLMAPLMEAGLIEVNPRGHYRCVVHAKAEPQSQETAAPAQALQNPVLSPPQRPPWRMTQPKMPPQAEPEKIS